MYLRHINMHDQRVLNDAFERKKQRAIDSSIPTEKEALGRLIKDGHWSEKAEEDIQEKKNYIKNLHQTKKQYDLQSHKASVQKTIDEQNGELNVLLFKRRELLGKTAEDFGFAWSNEEFIRHIIYQDTSFVRPKFSEQEFGEIDDFSELLDQYSAVSQRMEDEKIQEAVLSDPFSLYLSQTDKPYDFFARPIIKLSIYQLKMLAYGRMFLNIFQNVDDIPEGYRKSPDKLIDFVESKRRRDKKGSKNHNSMGMVGATKEDLEVYDPTAKKLDFAAELKKNGGKMDSMQLAALFGQKV